MKGDITIRPASERDARLQKIADRYLTTINQVIGMAAHELSHVSPAHLYQCLAAIRERDEELKQRRAKKPANTGI
jgi:hypothetical protein